MQGPARASRGKLARSWPRIRTSKPDRSCANHPGRTHLNHEDLRIRAWRRVVGAHQQPRLGLVVAHLLRKSVARPERKIAQIHAKPRTDAWIRRNIGRDARGLRSLLLRSKSHYLSDL